MDQWKVDRASASVVPLVAGYPGSGEVERWLRDSEDKQERFYELDRTLEELAEEQSLTPEACSGRPNPFGRRQSTEKPMAPESADWLNQTNDIMLSPVSMEPQAAIAQAAIDSKLNDVAAAGWSISIGMYKSFESPDISSDVVLTSAMTSAMTTVEVAAWKTEPSDDPTEQATSIPQAAKPAIAVLIVTAAGIWCARENEIARRKYFSRTCRKL